MIVEIALGILLALLILVLLPWILGAVVLLVAGASAIWLASQIMRHPETWPDVLLITAIVVMPLLLSRLIIRFFPHLGAEGVISALYGAVFLAGVGYLVGFLSIGSHLKAKLLWAVGAGGVLLVVAVVYWNWHALRKWRAKGGSISESTSQRLVSEPAEPRLPQYDIDDDLLRR